MRGEFSHFARPPTYPEMDYGGIAEYLHQAPSLAEPIRHGGKGQSYGESAENWSEKVKTKGETFLPEEFELTPATLVWLEKNHPRVDAEATLAKFRREAEAKGWMYKNWQRAFEGVVDKGMVNGWRSIVTFREGRKADPMWQTVIDEAKRYGFRDPDRMETPNSYRSAFTLWKGDPRNRAALRSVS